MYPFLRMCKEIWANRHAPPLGLTEAHVSHHICWPWDLDFWFELNNGRTLTLYDLGRVPMAIRTGLLRHMKANRWGITVAGNTLRYRVPLNWRGAIETQAVDGREMLDLKLHGTAIFVDAARVFALAQGLPVLGTRARLEGAAPGMHVAPRESEAWVSAFEFLQGLRLRAQVAETPAGASAPGNPNLIDVGTLDDIERSILKEALRVARRLLQRIELDYGR